MEFPVVSPALARRIDRVMNTLSTAGMEKVRALPGNRYGVEVRAFGEAVACLARKAGGPGWWNRVRGLQPAGAALIPEIVAYYRQNGLRCYVDIGPGELDEELGRRLGEAGLYACNYTTILYGAPQAGRISPPGDIEIRAVGPEQAELVATLWADGFEVPAGDDRETIRNIRKGWFTIPENHCYVAYVSGRPAAMAALYIQDGIGFLNVGATLPPYRRRGCHAALTRRRIADAAEAGCDLIIGHTGFGLVSQNNEERAGLRVAFTPVSWMDGRL